MWLDRLKYRRKTNRDRDTDVKKQLNRRIDRKEIPKDEKTVTMRYTDRKRQTHRQTDGHTETNRQRDTESV